MTNKTKDFKDYTAKDWGEFLIGLAFIALIGWAIFAGVRSCYSSMEANSGTDCYTTGQPGSAQYYRDLKRCEEGDW